MAAAKAQGKTFVFCPQQDTGLSHYQIRPAPWFDPSSQHPLATSLRRAVIRLVRDLKMVQTLRS